MNEAHWGYISLAYGITGVVVLGLILRIVFDYRRLRAELANLERNGSNKDGDVE
jgi:heme exporter protein CcmD